MTKKQTAESTGDAQLEPKTAPAIHLEPISNIYPEEDGSYILSRISTFRLNLEQRYISRTEISLTFFALTKESYSNFPLHLYIYINGHCTEIVALEREFDSATARFVVETNDVMNVGVQLRNRVLYPNIDDLRNPAIGLSEVTARNLTNDGVSNAAVHVSKSGPESRWTPEHFFNVDSPSTEPIFVIGSPRSGTSILTWAIGAHPNIYPIEETNFFPLLALSALANYHHASNAESSFLKRYDIDRQTFLQRHGAMMHEFICSIANTQHRFNTHTHFAGVRYTDGIAFTLARAAEDSKKRWVDGAPINTSVSYLLSMIYPKAKFIHLIRHPVSTIASLMAFEQAGGIARTYDESIDEWEGQVRFGRLLETALGPERVMTIRHEELSTATMEKMRNIFQFLDEPHYEPSGSRFQLRINSSNVDPQLREELAIRIESHERRTQLQALYEDRLTISQSAAIDQLTDVLNDIGVRLLKTVFGYRVDGIF